jgi:hypothetical protein
MLIGQDTLLVTLVRLVDRVPAPRHRRSAGAGGR